MLWEEIKEAVQGPSDVQLTDIKSMLCLARETAPDLPVPDVDDVDIDEMKSLNRNLPADRMIVGRVGNMPWSGMTLHTRYLSPLSPDLRVELFNTVVHQSVHLRQPWYQRPFRIREFEQEAYFQADSRTNLPAESIRNGTAGRPGCGH